jgi:putative transposon-encoded protein
MGDNLINIYLIYILMTKQKLKNKTKLSVKGILGFMEKTVTRFGTGAKVDCPKEYLGKKVYLVICRD